MNKHVYKSASCLWSWVSKSDFLTASSAKTCTDRPPYPWIQYLWLTVAPKKKLEKLKK